MDEDLNFVKPQGTVVYTRGKYVQQAHCVVLECSDEKHSQCTEKATARGLCKRHYRVLSQTRTLFDQIANAISRPAPREIRPAVKPTRDRTLAAMQELRAPNAPTDAEQFLSPNDIGKILNVTGEAVKQWIIKRRLLATKLANGYWKIRVLDFEAFLRARNNVGKRHVLVTGAQDGRMNVVVEAVRALGFEPIVAMNHVDALLKSFDQPPALFVINLSTKEFEPLKLAEKIRVNQAMRKIPILLVGDSNLENTVAERAVALSVQKFIKLPTDKDSVQLEIGRIVKCR